MKSNFTKGDNLANDENDESQRWEEIALSDDEVKESWSQRDDKRRRDEHSEEDNVVYNLAKESAKQVLNATPDFIAHISSVTMLCLLVYFILHKNGMTVDDLDPFLHLSYLWLTSISGGFLIQIFGLPPLLGMILASVLITNTTGSIRIPDTWGETITASGLAIILLLSGLELDLTSVQKSSGLAIRLTCIPGIVEATFSGLFSMLIFGMPIWLGLSLGFILGAVSPALVVVGMLKLQQQGYGAAKGIPSLVMAAASFDDIVAITGFSFFIALAIPSQHTSILYSAIHGPLSIAIGVGVGIIGGVVLSITKIWNKSWKRSTVAVLLVLCIMFGMKRLSYAGAGAMGSLITGIIASHNWEAGIPDVLAEAANKEFAKSTESHVSIVWKMLFEPLLFGFIGSSLDFDLLNGSLGKSFGIVIIGVTFRLTAAYFATGGDDSQLTDIERAFISLVWIPKATVQAALCFFPLMLVRDVIEPDHQDFNQYILWGNQIVSTAILSILITAPLGLLFIQHLGPKWLTKDEVSAEQQHNEITESEDNDDNRKGEISGHISRIDKLLQKISLSSNQVDQSCNLAEIRHNLWKCKSTLGIK